MSTQTIAVAGIQLDIWSNKPQSDLPITVLIILHGRGSTRSAVADIAGRMLHLQSEEEHWKRQLVVVTFDHRNHGSRLLDPIANKGWNFKDTSKHNARHALDMYAIQVGSALDVSTVIDFLPSYLYPANERTIDQWALAGFSLGGHSTWIAAKNDPRIEVVVPIVGCPDFLPLMHDRASRKGIDELDPNYFPQSLIAYIRKHDPAVAPFNVADASNPFLNKKVLAIAGGKDPLVPWIFSRAFFDALEVGETGVKECFIDLDAKHEWTSAMGDRMAEFIKKHCLVVSRMRLTRSQQTTEIDAKIAAHAVHAFKDALPSRTTIVEDLLPTERVQLQEHTDIKIVDYETIPFSQLTRTFKQQKTGEDTTFKIGDTVEIKSAAKLPLIAIIVSLHKVAPRSQDVEENEVALSQWKATVHRFELAGSTKVNRKARPHEENEVYYLVKDALLIDVCSILNHCIITPKASKTKNSSKKGSKLTEYVIEASYDPVTGIYYPIQWDDFHSDKMTVHEKDRVSIWNVDIQSSASGRRQNQAEESDESSEESSDEEEVAPESPSEEDSDQGEDGADEELDVTEPVESDSETERRRGTSSSPRKKGGASPSKTPSKKRKRNLEDSFSQTPVKKRKGMAQPTPHSKAALRARKKFKIRPPSDMAQGQDNTTLYTMVDDPYLRAMHTLHVGERPDSLPCRDEEYVNIFENVIGLLQEASGGCIYISGVPGTGKTATVHTVIRELKIMAMNNECNPFTFVEINGLRVPEPSAAYPLLWEAVTGHDASAQGHLKISSKEALKRLVIHFGVGASENTGPACIVLMDELDQLVTTKQDVVYNFFNWPNLVGSRLIVLAVANTHDLPERTLSAKVRSRLGMVRINFAPYTKAQLAEIVNSRLNRAKQGATNLQTVMKPDAVLYAATRVGGVSGDARRVLDISRRTIERIREKARPATIADVMHVISLTQNTPTAGYVAQCSFHEKAMLAAALIEVRWTGVEEFTWAKLRSRYLGLLHQLTNDGDDDTPYRTPSEEEMANVLDSLVHSDFLSIESTVIANRKPLADRKILMTVEKQEVKRVLVETGQRWHAHLGVDV